MTWILLPLIGAFIGWVTNWIAVQLLFWPKEPILGVQGLLPKRQADFAGTVAEVVGGELVQIDEMLGKIDDVDLSAEIAPLIDAALDKGLAEFRGNKFLQNWLTDERIAGWREHLMLAVRQRQPQILARLKAIAKERIDVRGMAFAKIGGKNIERLEGVVKTIARKEFRAIECWGAVLGAVIGLIQAAVVAWVQ